MAVRYRDLSNLTVTSFVLLTSAKNYEVKHHLNAAFRMQHPLNAPRVVQFHTEVQGMEILMHRSLRDRHADVLELVFLFKSTSI